MVNRYLHKRPSVRVYFFLIILLFILVPWRAASGQTIKNKTGSDPISVSMKLVDSDKRFTLADKAGIEIKVTVNQLLGAASNLKIRLDKKAVMMDEIPPIPTRKLYRETPAFMIQYSKKNTYNRQYYGDKPIKFDFEPIDFNLFGIAVGESKTFHIDILSDSEINSWIFHHLIRSSQKYEDKGIRNEKDISQILQVELWDYSKNENVFEKKPVITIEGEPLFITFPYFDSGHSLLADSDKNSEKYKESRIHYYLFGDYSTHQFGPNIRRLAARAARYNRDTLNTKDFLTQNLMPENEKQVVDQIAQYLHDILQPKIYPEDLLEPTSMAAYIFDGVIDFGKPFSSASSGMKIPFWNSENTRLGFACIEHAQLFANLTRNLGFPTREINTQVYWGPERLFFENFFSPAFGGNRDGGHQDASTEVFYYNETSKQHDWNYYSLFNTDELGVITDKKTRYSGFFNGFLQWAGVKSLGYREQKNRFLMNISEMHKSDIWEQVTVGSPGILGGDVLYFKVYSPVKINLKLLDGSVVGGTEASEKNSTLANEFLFLNLSEKNQSFLNPKQGVYYIPEGLPVMSSDADLVEHGTYQTLMVPESLAGDISKIKLNIIGTDTGEYTIATTKVTSNEVIQYESITSKIKKGERTTLGGSTLKVDFTYDREKDSLFIGEPISLRRSEEQQSVYLVIKRWNNIDAEEILQLKIKSLPSFIRDINWEEGQVVHFSAGHNEKTVPVLINAKPTGDREEGEIALAADSTNPKFKSQPQIIIPVRIGQGENKENTRDESMHQNIVALPIRADAPKDFSRKNTIDYVDGTRKDITVYDRIAIFYTPSHAYTDGFMWEVFSSNGKGTSNHGYEIDYDPLTLEPAKKGSPGKYVAIISLKKAGTYTLKTCPLNPPPSLLGAVTGLPSGDTEMFETEGSFSVTSSILRFKDFIAEPLPDPTLEDGEFLGTNHITFEKTGKGNHVTLAVKADWEKRVSVNNSIRETSHETYATGTFIFPESLDPVREKMGEGLFSVVQPDKLEWMIKNAKSPYVTAHDHFMAVKFYKGMVYAVNRTPFERGMFIGPKAAKPIGLPKFEANSTKNVFRELTRGWGDIGEKKIVFRGNPKDSSQTFGTPEQYLVDHLRDPDTLFVIPIRIELHENTRGIGDGFVKKEIWGYAIYGATDAPYSGPAPTGDRKTREQRKGSIESPDSTGNKESDSDSSGKKVARDVPGEDEKIKINPDSSRISAVIKEWINKAEPVQNAQGADLRYDKWGRVHGRAVGGTITLNGNPDDVSGRTPEQYVWDKGDTLDSLNLCTLKTYVITRLDNGDLSECIRNKTGGSTGGLADTQNREGIALPDLKGSTYKEASDIIRNSGLKVLDPELGSHAPDASMTGKIEKIIIKNTGPLRSGDGVTPVIYDEPDTGTKLPDFINLKAVDAAKAVKQAGFIPEFEIGLTTNEPQKEGVVFSQTPLAGTKLKPGSTIILKIYNYIADLPTVPNIVGKDPASAANAVKKAGFNPVFELGTITKDKEKENQVYYQNPTTGATVKAGSDIVIKLYTYRDYTVTMPLVTGLALLEAKNTIEKAGLKVSVNLEGPALKHSDEGKVSKQVPAPGKKINKGGSVDLWVYGEYKKVITPVIEDTQEQFPGEYCSLGKAGFIYQPERNYYVFRSLKPRKITSRKYSREYSFIADNYRNAEATVSQMKREGKMELVFEGKMPGLCTHLRKSCALSTMPPADKDFFRDICGKWEDPR